MPTVQVQCPRCSASSSVDSRLLAGSAACPRCGGPLITEAESETINLHGVEATGPPTSPGPVLTPADFELPEQFGRYRILQMLGQGGMGAVYLAHDAQLQRKVALKVPFFRPSDGAVVIERFVREARAAAKLDHPNLCQVFDVGQIGGVNYLTMPFIEGKPLSTVIDRGKPVPASQAAALVHKLALAMAVAHENGIVHRDLKPANIMVSRHRELVIMDFGLARLDEGQDSSLTGSGAVLGTPMYMSPEQVEGRTHEIGAATDIYSLGVILYELLTGRLPYQGSVAKIMAQIVYTEPPPLSRFRPEIDRALETICLKTISKAPADRYASMAELAAALGEYLKAQPGKTGIDPPAGQPVAVPVAPIASPAAESKATVEAVLTDSNLASPPAPPKPALLGSTGLRWPPRKRLLVGAGAAALMLSLGIIVIIITHKDGTKTRIEVDDTAKVEVAQEGGKTPTSGGASKTAVPPPLAITPFDAAKAREHQESWARHLGVPVEMTNSIGMKLVLIPPGEFDMGSTPGEIAWALEYVDLAKEPWCRDSIESEGPRHRARITAPFYAGAYLVTQGEYEEVVGTNPSAFCAKQADDSTYYAGQPLETASTNKQWRENAGMQAAGIITGRYPVDSVNWDDTYDFCRKLSALTAERSAGRAYRLPTEAQWEYACRAGTTSKWSFGDNAADLPQYACCREHPGNHPQPVGECKPNAWGLFDMHGNVKQWCTDWHSFDYYSRSVRDDPTGPDRGGSHVLRGSYWFDHAPYARSAIRSNYVWPLARDPRMGFRVILDVPGLKRPGEQPAASRSVPGSANQPPGEAASALS